MRLGRGKVILLVILGVLTIVSMPYIYDLATYLTHTQTPYFVIPRSPIPGFVFPGITIQNLGAPARNVRVEWISTVNGTAQTLYWSIGDMDTFQKATFFFKPAAPDGTDVLVKWDGGEQTVEVY